VRSTLLLACGSTLGVLLLWVALLHLFQVNPFFGRGPDAVLRDLFISPAAASHRLILLDALGTTIFDAMLGFVVGTGLATAIATLFVAYPVLARWFMPLAIALRSVPVIAATPLLVVMFGRGLGVSIAIATLFTFFPTLINVMEGLRSAPPRAIELMHAYAASRWTTIRKVRMVYALPSMFASARISILGSVLGVLVAEWLATGVGLGSVMIQARAEYDFDHLWTAGVVLTVASAAIYASVGWLEASMARR
jgi:ABC-type nitrate/sulfonate/bicarbonate transport system permease component